MTTKTILLKQETTLLLVAFAAVVFALALILPSYANAALTQTLDFGDSNGEVTELQTYLSTNSAYYPSGLVTGYFGQLTKAGVERFQTSQGIVTSGTPATTGYGRVGPITLTRINALMSSSGNAGSNISWDTSPVLSNPTVTVGSTSATFYWTTNEATVGHVYWSTGPLTMNEATGPRQTPYVSGTLAVDSGNLQTIHSVTVSNLQPNTTYYYLVRSVDSAGNMSMIWPRTLTTSN